jgi:hypothetical protein
LRVVCILQHLNDFNQSFFGFLSSNYHLKYSYSCTSLAFPELWIRV